MSAELTPSERIAFDAVDAAARDGRPCPSNVELSELTCTSRSNGSCLIKVLERKGVLRLDRSGAFRIATVVATGMTTATKCERVGQATWTDERVSRLVDLVAAHASYDVMAADLGVSRDQISYQLRTMRVAGDPRIPGHIVTARNGGRSSASVCKAGEPLANVEALDFRRKAERGSARLADACRRLFERRARELSEAAGEPVSVQDAQTIVLHPLARSAAAPRLIERPAMRRPAPLYTLGGVAPEAM